MITTDTTNKLGTTVTKDLRTSMQAYDFNLSKLERVMSGAGKVAALGHELERRGLKRTIVVTGKTLGGSALLEKVTSHAARSHSKHWLRTSQARADGRSFLSSGS